MEKSWVRLVLASSIDGRIAYPEGGKTQLGKSGDRIVLEESLAWADGTLAGGQTLRDHESICLIKNKKLITKRISEGKDEQPISLIASNQIYFPNNWPFFKQPIQRWLLQNQSKNYESKPPKGFHKIFNLKPKWHESLQLLNKQGLSKIVLLGGANLISSFLTEDLINELQITITPYILGGSYCWVSSKLNNLNSILKQDKKWQLKENKNLGKSELLIRYIKHNKLKK